MLFNIPVRKDMSSMKKIAVIKIIVWVEVGRYENVNVKERKGNSNCWKLLRWWSEKKRMPYKCEKRWSQIKMQSM